MKTSTKPQRNRTTEARVDALEEVLAKLFAILKPFTSETSTSVAPPAEPVAKDEKPPALFVKDEERPKPKVDPPELSIPASPEQSAALLETLLPKIKAARNREQLAARRDDGRAYRMCMKLTEQDYISFVAACVDQEKLIAKGIK